MGLEQLTTPQERKQATRRLEAIERANDKLAYKLYGLSDDEVALVESHFAGQA